MPLIDPKLISRPAAPDEIKQISPFLEMTATGIKRLRTNEDAEAVLAFWFANPQGSIWGRPAWGHPFESRLFSTGQTDELIVIEMMAIKKIRQDIPRIKIRGVRAEFAETDLILMTVIYEANGALLPFTGKVSN